MTWQFKKIFQRLLISIWVNIKISYLDCHFYDRKLIGLILELVVRMNSLLVIDVYDFCHLMGILEFVVRTKSLLTIDICDFCNLMGFSHRYLYF